MNNLKLLLFQIKYGSANKKKGGAILEGRKEWSMFAKRVELKGYSKDIYKFTAFNMTLFPQNVLDSDRCGPF